MKGWVLCENGKILYDSADSILIFKTKEALYDYYSGALGDLDSIKRVEYMIAK